MKTIFSRILLPALCLILSLTVLLYACSRDMPKQTEESQVEEGPAAESAPELPEEERAISVDDEELERDNLK